LLGPLILQSQIVAVARTTFLALVVVGSGAVLVASAPFSLCHLRFELVGGRSVWRDREWRSSW
jgi:hypothetical protein